jgi:hypothetical protein
VTDAAVLHLELNGTICVELVVMGSRNGDFLDWLLQATERDRCSIGAALSDWADGCLGLILVSFAF